MFNVYLSYFFIPLYYQDPINNMFSPTKYTTRLFLNKNNTFIELALLNFAENNRRTRVASTRGLKQLKVFATASDSLRLRFSSSYVQGQSPLNQPRIREYFYYIDHQGMLFLDDSRIKNFTSCFKDKKFLSFFFKRLRQNDTDRYVNDFPYLSLCGRERNYVRCDDLPIVFTHVINMWKNKDDKSENKETKNRSNLLSYAHADDLLTVPFQPERIFMSIETGRVYHPAPEIVGGIGLVSSKLAIEFSKRFEFLNGEDRSPTHFIWDDEKYELNNVWYKTKAIDKTL